MRTDIEERACDLALYIIEHQATVRSAAKQFGISKSTVHKDLSQRLPAFNRALYLQVKEVLDLNKAERHIRGGIATRRKYKGTKKPVLRERKGPFRGSAQARERNVLSASVLAVQRAPQPSPHHQKGGNPSTRGSRLPGRLHCSDRWGYSTEIK